jgi:hypothetical protein
MWIIYLYPKQGSDFMKSMIPQKGSGPRWLTIFIGAYLLFLYMVLCLTAFIFNNRQLLSKLGNFPTPTASATPTPHILVHQPVGNNEVKHEDFSTNNPDWGLSSPFGKLEVINGKLILQSNTSGYFVIGENQKLISPGQKYYVQADFFTDIDTDKSYGLAFGLNQSTGTFYLFEVWPQTSDFRLFKYAAGDWGELIPFSHGNIRSYPEANTLSVYFNMGNIQLYINGELVSTCVDDSPLQFTGVGAFSNNSGYRVIMDDLFIYNEK